MLCRPYMWVKCDAFKHGFPMVGSATVVEFVDAKARGSSNRFNSKYQKSTRFLQTSTSPEIWFGTRCSIVRFALGSTPKQRRSSPLENECQRMPLAFVRTNH